MSYISKYTCQNDSRNLTACSLCKKKCLAVALICQYVQMQRLYARLDQLFFLRRAYFYLLALRASSSFSLVVIIVMKKSDSSPLVWVCSRASERERSHADKVMLGYKYTKPNITIRTRSLIKLHRVHASQSTVLKSKERSAV